MEQKAPEHYKKAEDVKITVKDTGKVQKLKVVDERIPEVPDTPQTGNRKKYSFVCFSITVWNWYSNNLLMCENQSWKEEG